ncbi:MULTISPECIES: diguanylate cyclase domain-containing protein [unclassified Clostridioides]|uniref:diguanylate cyclase domain-containing protein n=1 Tax=unclassified Clostridioides TaxID=2635829 RepID=UPI001D0BFCFC|nr:GGDEF domain-containing protein [Clostridioides sp. ES-S-0001-02]MCC0653117.1 GGDEF domain-containing protein [Clostridioides sp. ES-S-0001-03]MCC0656875.1 GGDEF domain-containing protein [Clostridioides sp. ES-S-0123-01]MCC0673392.1 GGDEF domain-containing protein [Clostridioides sp. ES-S-0145-01]MCC0681586.1 GGDEF domain-containing protein [Clostridioides sp. ES-S-0005-03]MCC0764622.1 GGDEF domain-containing protein [Clostridioides sp. ES-S-0006-03]UDN48455.1 GGDEF domain-containing prot
MNGTNKKIDLLMLSLFVFIFLIVGIVILSIRTENKLNVFIMLSVIFFIIMLTYLSNSVVGLITSSITIFIYTSYILYNNITHNIDVEFISYIWIIAIPISSIIMGNINKNINELQLTNIKLTEQYKELVTIDNETGLRNLKIFYNDVDMEISKSVRYTTTFSLMIVKLPYYENLQTIFGESKTNKIVKYISSNIVECTRNEDIIYSLQKDMIGILMPNTALEGSKVVRDRIKKRIKELNLDLNNKGRYVNIDVKIAILEYKDTFGDSINFKNMVEEELQYDV